MVEWNLPPDEIERRSLATIDAEAGEHQWRGAEWRIVRRMVYTTADFDFVRTARIHPKAVKSGCAALKKGATVFTDTNMVKAGIGLRWLEPLGCKIECMHQLPGVAEAARAQGVTRSLAGVDASLAQGQGAVYAIGNAPTALLRLIEHIRVGKLQPALVVGMPVGFVNADFSHEELAKIDTPFVTALGRKGGSALAATVVNTLGRMLSGVSYGT